MNPNEHSNELLEHTSNPGTPVGPRLGTPNQFDLEMIMQRIIQLENENARLRNGMPLHAHQPMFSPPAAAPPKIPLPDKFDGTRDKLRGFLNQLDLVFKLQPDWYSTESMKVAWAGTLLSGRALTWFNPMLEKPEDYQHILNSFDEFKRAIKASFAPIDEANVSAGKIRRLRQGKMPCSVYAAEFTLLAADIGWNDAALIQQFRAGLSKEVKDMLVFYDYPTSFLAFKELAIKCDTRLHENRMDSGYYQQRAPNPTDMEIDAVGTRRGPLTPEEREKRMRYGLCLVCGGNDHLRAVCPVAKHNRQRQVPGVQGNESGL